MAVGGDLGWWGPDGALTAMWYTRTITGLAEETQAAVTITSGTSTLTITETVRAQPNDIPYPVYSESSSLLDSGSIRIPIPPTASAPPATAPSLAPAPPPFNDSYSTGTGSGPTSVPSSSASSILNTSSSTTSSLRPIGNSINPLGCPTINNTIYTTENGEQFQLQCYRQYGGPVSVGLDQSNFRDCIEECSKVNQGFSAVRCYGTTWLKYFSGIHCNLKGQSGLATYTTHYDAVSAVLLGAPGPPVGLFGVGDGLTKGLPRQGAEGKEAAVAVVGGDKGQLMDSDPGTWRL
ncbi:MAG: hypothetical protein Q9182_004982 [Xanthomendoza sp. 2 TL-2023]